MSISTLPDVNFVSTDPDLIRNEIISGYETFTGKTLFPADPERLFLLSLANMIIQQRVLINLAAKQTLLRYAAGDVLDNMGARVETSRILAKPAITTIRFTLSTPRPSAVSVPLGTRVTPGSNLNFKTVKVAQIPAGSLYVDVDCECETPGTIGNGFLPGQINSVVDPFAWLDNAVNQTTSSNGAEREEDDSYRERIYLAPEAFSVAGPEGAYEFWTKTASKDIIDVRVHSPAPGVVEIVPLMVNGELPSSDVLDAVLEVCSAKTVRPLTDNVTVEAPTQVSYDIELEYWIDKADEASAESIQTAVNAAIDEYRLWQKSKLGRDINPSQLSRFILNAGAKRVEITTPVYADLELDEVASDDDVDITYGGVEGA